MSTYGTTHLASLLLSIPSAGAARADIRLEDGGVPTGKAALTIGSLVYQMSVLRADFDDAGRPRAVLVAGIGWQNVMTSPISFQSDAGIRLSTILSALASAAKETIEQPPDRTVGDHFEINASRSPAIGVNPGTVLSFAQVLDSLVRQGVIATWRVDPDGVTRFTPRTGSALSAATRATLIRNDSGAAIATWGTDDPAEFLPGNSVEGTTIRKSVIREQDGTIEVDVHAKGTKGAPTIREMIRNMLPVSSPILPYIVHSQNGDGTLNLVPDPSRPNLAELQNVQQWTIGGVKFHAQPGQQVSVAYADEKGEVPMCFAFRLDSGTFLPAARQSDTVRVLLPPAVINGTAIIGGVPSAITAVMTFPVGYTLGNIDTGSGRVDIE